MPTTPLDAGFVDDPYAACLESIVAHTNIAKAGAVADLGAGDASFAQRIRHAMPPSASLVLVDREPFGDPEIPRTHRLHVDLAEAPASEQVQLAIARFVLLQSAEPRQLLARLVDWVAPEGTLVLMEPVTSTGRVGDSPISADRAAIPSPDIGLHLVGMIADAGLTLTHLGAVTPVGLGGSTIGSYLAQMTGVTPDPQELILLPTLVIAVASVSADARAQRVRPG